MVVSMVVLTIQSVDIRLSNYLFPSFFWLLEKKFYLCRRLEILLYDRAWIIRTDNKQVIRSKTW